MTGLVTTTVLLAAIGEASKAAAAEIGTRGIAAFLKRARLKNAPRRAGKAALKRYPYPGAKAALRIWRKSPSFSNILLAAELGNRQALTKPRLVQSFLKEVPNHGWGGAAKTRATNLTRAFLDAYLTELVGGVNGRSIAFQHAEARFRQAQAERSGIRISVDSSAADIRGIDAKVDRLLEQRAVPSEIGNLIASSVLDSLSEALRTLDAEGALNLAMANIRSLDKAIETIEDVDGAIADALRSHRQRLRFAAATAASWQGRMEESREHARIALELGDVDPEWHRQAATALFNSSLVEDLRVLVARMEEGTSVKRLSSFLLAFLDQEWDIVADGIEDSMDADILLMRASGHVEGLDPLKVDAVRHVSELIDASESGPSLPATNILRARTTVDLLEKVVSGYTPLEFDRKPISDAIVRRTIDAIESTSPDTLLRASALTVLADAAELLRDDILADRFEREVEALSEPIRSEAFAPFDPLPTLDEIESRTDSGQINQTMAALLRAAVHESNNEASLVESTLTEAIFGTSDLKLRAKLLRALLRFLAKAGRDESLQILLNGTPLADADRWLLEQEFKRSSPDGEGAHEFLLDLDVVALQAMRLMASPEPDGGKIDAEERPSTWTARLVRLLPSRQSYLLHAEALLHEHEGARLSETVGVLDPAYAERAAELKAFALQDQERYPAAAEAFAIAAKDYPNSERIAVNASAALLHVGRIAEVRQLLHPFIEDGSNTVGVLVHYARAIIAEAPEDPDVASTAFDLYARAFEIQPSRDLATYAWIASRGSGREKEAGRYFVAMTAGAKSIDVQDSEDVAKAFLDSEGPFTRITGDTAVLAEHIASEMERARQQGIALDRFSSAHAFAYSDVFRFSGRAWQNWARRTRRDEGRGDYKAGHAILADWPSSVLAYSRDYGNVHQELFADSTALLTLGVLGRDSATQLLRAAGRVHVIEGTLARMSDELGELEREILMSGERANAQIIRMFEGKSAVVAFDERVDSAAPVDLVLGAHRIALGIATILEGRYVYDQDVEEWPVGSRSLVMSSLVLLATLNADGLISAEEADNAAVQRPDTFGGWSDVDALDQLPDILVFDHDALLDWFAAGLLGRIEERVRIGARAWENLSQEAEDRAAATLAYHRLKNTIEVLRVAADQGILCEVQAAKKGDADDDEEVKDDRETIRGAWATALQSLHTARANGLQLWADDRFYPLLLWMGGPTITSPEIDALRGSLAEWAKQTPPLSTVALLDRLVRDDSLDIEVAGEMAGCLFDQGYRPVHPLVLVDAVTQFRLAGEGALRGRFHEIKLAIEEVPSYLPETIDAGRRVNFSRSATSNIAEQMIVASWTIPELSEEQRRTLANSFLEAAESVFHQQLPLEEARRADRNRLIFWRGISGTLAMTQFEGPDAAEWHDKALRWLGDAAAERIDDAPEIARLLEDNVFTIVKLFHDSDAPVPEGEDAVDATKRLIFRNLVPLIGSRLIEHIDPLMRRTVGVLAGLDRGGCIDTVLETHVGDKKFALTIPEEEEEARATSLILEEVAGEVSLASQIRIRIDFTYNMSPPADWIAGGVPSEPGLPIEVSCPLFTILWNDVPEVHEHVFRSLLYHLAITDPQLARQMVALEDGFLRGDATRSKAARNDLAVALLTSTFVDLQRDLGHGLWRLRKSNPKRLTQFLGLIGEQAAKEITAANPSLPTLAQATSSGLFPTSHLLARHVFVETKQHRKDVLAAVESMTENSLEDGTEPSDLETWLSARRNIAEYHNDPFVAAAAFRELLLASEILPSNTKVNLGNSTLELRVWIARYLDTVLGIQEHNGMQAYALRARFARAALILSIYATSGEPHFQSLEGDEDPLALWLERCWLFASKLFFALPAIFGGLAEATTEAERVSAEFGLDQSGSSVLDFFDPFALSRTDNIEQVLILAVLVKSISPESLPPSWWSEGLKLRVAEIAEQPNPIELAPIDKLGDRLCIGVPLRGRDLALRLLDAIRQVGD